MLKKSVADIGSMFFLGGVHVNDSTKNYFALTFFCFVQKCVTEERYFATMMNACCNFFK